MDEQLRELEKQCYQNQGAACHRACMAYLRAGYSFSDIPPAVLHGHTQWGLLTQEPFDFRQLMVMDEDQEGWSGSGNIRFNGGHYLSIIAGTRACSTPDAFVPVNEYEHWEVHTSQPEYRETTYYADELDDDDLEELSNFRQSPDYDVHEDSGSIEVVMLNRDFQVGGVLHDFPHRWLFSSYDQVICPTTAQVQDMVDFLRARFGWREDPKTRHFY
jgi:hypothetical protein